MNFKNIKKSTLTEVYRFTCGSELGYVHVDNRGVHAPIEALPKTLEGLRGNFRKFVREALRRGCTHYSLFWQQGVPGKGFSNRYCFRVYIGYRL